MKRLQIERLLVDSLLEKDLQAQHVNKRQREAPNKHRECEKHMNIVSEVKGILKEQKSETGNGSREVDNKAEMGINTKKIYKTYRRAF